MGKKSLLRAVVVLACCGSLVTTSCGDQSQPKEQAASPQAPVQIATAGAGPIPGNPILFLVWAVNAENEAATAQQLQELLAIAAYVKTVFSTIL